MNKTWKAFLGVVLIYLFGCFSGAVSFSIFAHHRMLDFLQHPAVALSEALEKRLTGNLDLDDNQKKQVHDYFLQNLEQRKDLQKEIQPRVRELNRQTMEQITAILQPDQADLFHQNIEKFRKRWAAAGLSQDTEKPASPRIEAGGPATNSGAGTSH